LSEEEEARVSWLFSRYPTRQAAILPILWMLQEKIGWIPEEAIHLVAERCRVPSSHVYGIVSFYTMYNREPVGRFHIQVCTNLSCQLLGSEHVLDCLRRRLGVDLGGTTPDGLFTLSEVECLAACEMAPAAQLNDDFIGPLDERGVDALIIRLKAEAAAEPTAARRAEAKR
jgi:NADH-quinone oxidoreductase E subunit